MAFAFPSILRLVTELPHYCIFERFVDIPCPGCNITLALVQIAHLHIAESISTNPGGIALVLTVTFQIGVHFSALARFVTFSTAQQLVALTTRIFFSFLMLHWLITLFNHH
ncbi:MAG: DUF2752 domain-containing protein [Zoogloeaceae bacterium]|nr:DUF2752 domain-containing protein [Zoogloeaceae bacterium]